MKKSLFLWSLLAATLFAGCTNTATNTVENTDVNTSNNNNTVSYSSEINCPLWSEYRESKFENWNIKAQWCFWDWNNIMEWHWIYYFENWGKDSEWEMINDKREWAWTFYDEDWNNTIIAKGNYEDDLEEWNWEYYADWEHICTDVFSQWVLTDEWTCEQDNTEAAANQAE